MSKQLTLSSVIACLAMAAVALGYSPDKAPIEARGKVASQQVELMPNLPLPSVFN